jgi:hypothetical protein
MEGHDEYVDGVHYFRPSDGFVQTSETVKLIAGAVLAGIHGDAFVAEQAPMTAVLDDGIWSVEGRENAGGFVLRVAKQDGRILSIHLGDGREMQEEPEEVEVQGSSVGQLMPEEETAIRIAEVILAAVYGTSVIREQRPFEARLNGDVWTVQGTLPADFVGGVAIAELSSVDARILRVSHSL